jgi:exocyst complex component 4
MSRAPPFPTRRPRTPPSQSQNGLGSPPTRPLQISRDKGTPRPSISGNNTLSQSPQRIIPARPQRSELRGSSRTSEYSDSERSYIPRPPRGSEDLQDIPGSSSQYNDQRRPRTTSSSTTASASTMSRPSRGQSGYDPTAAALPSVISAFQNAGKKRGTQDASDVEYELARKQEIEKERQRQERIKARAPGRQTNGRARAGDIDGSSSVQPDSLLQGLISSFQLYSIK